MSTKKCQCNHLYSSNALSSFHPLPCRPKTKQKYINQYFINQFAHTMNSPGQPHKLFHLWYPICVCEVALTGHVRRWVSYSLPSSLHPLNNCEWVWIHWARAWPTILCSAVRPCVADLHTFVPWHDVQSRRRGMMKVTFTDSFISMALTLILSVSGCLHACWDCYGEEGTTEIIRGGPLSKGILSLNWSHKSSCGGVDSDSNVFLNKISTLSL